MPLGATVRQPFSVIFWRSVLYGVVGGLLSGFVKLGWEILLPPRTPARNATNPPQHLLEQFGIPSHVTHATFTYSDQHVFWVSLIIHFGFSIVVAILYCIAAEYWHTITLWQGTVFGVAIWVAFHLIIMPAMGTVPAPWAQPFSEHFSEFLGHIVWAWAIELVRRGMNAGAKVDTVSTTTAN